MQQIIKKYYLIFSLLILVVIFAYPTNVYINNNTYESTNLHFNLKLDKENYDFMEVPNTLIITDSEFKTYSITVTEMSESQSLADAAQEYKDSYDSWASQPLFINEYNTEVDGFSAKKFLVSVPIYPKKTTAGYLTIIVVKENRKYQFQYNMGYKQVFDLKGDEMNWLVESFEFIQ